MNKTKSSLSIKTPSAKEILNPPPVKPMLADPNPFECALKTRRAVGNMFRWRDESKNQDDVYIEILNCFQSFSGEQRFSDKTADVTEKPPVEKLAIAFVTFRVRIEADGTTRHVQKIPFREANVASGLFVDAESFLEETEVSQEGNALLKEAESCMKSAFFGGAGGLEFSM